MTHKEFNELFNQEFKKFETEHPEFIGINNQYFKYKINDYIIKHLEEIIKNVK